MTSATRLAVAGGIATFLGAFTLVQVTETAGWLIPAGMLIALISGSGIYARHKAVPQALIPPIQVVLSGLFIGLFVASDEAFLGILPTWAWFDRLYAVIVEGFEAVNRYAAPVPVEPGIFVLLLGGVAIVAMLVDLFAVTLRRVLLAGVPLVAIYAVAAAVVAGGVAWMLFMLVAAGFLILLVADRRHYVAHWGRAVTLSERHGSGEAQAASLARNGRRLGAAAIIAAVIVPALLPGLPESVFGRGGGGGGVIRTNNPIVDMKRDLVRPDNVPVFRYRTTDPTPDYIRVATLDAFDGDLWHQSSREVPKSHRVDRGLPSPPGLSSSVPRKEISTEFEIGDNFESSWLPMPYPPKQVDIDGDWRYDTATLDVVGIKRNTAEQNYVVTSLELDYDAAALREAPPMPDPMQKYTALPANLPQAVADLAERLTGSAHTDFDKAAALQRYFRTTGGFTYDLSVRPGNSSTALMDFLTDKHGYCEQFSAAMAIMARSLGIPARVATGYLPGTNVSGETWVVRAHDAHAWPELYFEGIGWVRFEPTPQARTGTAPSWTLPPVASQTPGSDTTSEPVPGVDNAPRDPSSRDRLDESLGLGETADAGSGFPWQPVLAGAAVLLVLAMPFGAAWARRRLRWRAAGDDVTRSVDAAWAELRETMRDAGLDWDPARTPRLTGQRLLESVPLSQDDTDLLNHIVRTTEVARYARSASPIEGLREDSSLLRRAIMGARPWRHRVRALLWPSGASDVVSVAANRVADGLDWVDTAAEGVRGSVRSRVLQRSGRPSPGGSRSSGARTSEAGRTPGARMLDTRRPPDSRTLGVGRKSGPGTGSSPGGDEGRRPATDGTPRDGRDTVRDRPRLAGDGNGALAAGNASSASSDSGKPSIPIGGMPNSSSAGPADGPKLNGSRPEAD